jgi:hypothetical protein
MSVTGVLTLGTHFAPGNLSASGAWTTLTAATGLVGAISFLRSAAISRQGMARLASRRTLGATIAFGAIYFAFAVLLIGSLYSSSEEIQHAGNAALWFSSAFLYWDTWRGSRQMPESPELGAPGA